MAEGSDAIQTLIAQIARLPGLGPRSARRIVLALIRRRTGQMAQLAAQMAEVAARSTDAQVAEEFRLMIDEVTG